MKKYWQFKSFKKFLLVFFITFFVLPFILISFIILGQIARNIGKDLGIIRFNEYVSGTGSMYPTFPKGESKDEKQRSKETVARVKARSYPGGINLFGKKYFGYLLQRGDIIAFSSKKTEEIIQKEASDAASLSHGFIKRVIALPGERLEIRNGFVNLNGKILDEPYIASARSTYGGDFLPDCKIISIPDGKVFAMGDNRKGSDDSRFDLGLVDLSDIESVIPLTSQSSTPGKLDLLKSNWRDTSKDLKEVNLPVLDINEYLTLLNQKRNEAGLKSLKYQEKLSKSAKIRADVILNYNDLSPEATKSAINMEKAMRDVGYSNIIWGEAPVKGFFSASELIENYFQFPQSRKFLLNKDYQDMGVSAEIGEINGCPVQIVVTHFAGYIPPNYTKEEVQGWEEVTNGIDKILPGWEKALDYTNINKNDLRQLLDLMKKRRSRANQILSRLQSNQWLSEEEKNWVKEDEGLFNEIEKLAKKINQT